METLNRISQIRKNKEEYAGVQEDVVFLWSGILGENLVRQANFAGAAVKVLAAFSDKPVQSDFFEVFSLDKVKNLVPRLDVKTAILCVPHGQAAAMADLLMDSGITRIINWSGNFLTSERADILNEDLPEDILEK